MNNEIKVLHDQHIHTEYSEDSKEKITRYVERAIEKGCEYVVMTDHLDFDVASSGHTWLADFVKQREEINELQKVYGDKIKILQGIELGYKDAYFDEIKRYSELLPYDIVNLSIHDVLDIDFYYDEAFIKHGSKEMVSLYLEQYKKAVKSDIDYNVVCHIDYAFKSAIRTDKNLRFSMFEEDIKEIMSTIISREKAYEINTKVLEFIPWDIEHLRYVLRLYKSLGGTDLTMSSDAHEVDRYMSSFDKYRKIIKEEGFDKLCYFVNKKKHYYCI